ncbi:MAG: hypothetical protein CVU91_08025 [Firmicutes bacterium HGW-Firmicutes-16]|nr:MAG: hypothetical protein CVU91_08025 [Firmicutes bacterium HGW-Firmicutes-16]
MKTLNQLIDEYTSQLQKGEIQTAYKEILEFFGKLKSDYIKKYPQYDTGGIYQGYMDMTYLPLSTAQIKDKGLKIAIVYLHEKGTFEVWLSARNRDIAKRFDSVFNSISFDNRSIFHDDSNPDAIIECTLISKPDFENQDSLTEIIEHGVEGFVTAITGLLF